jgi:streptomycin 6-kinase
MTYLRAPKLSTADDRGILLELPEAFKKTIIGVHGESGVAWLRALPALIRECVERFAISLNMPFDGLSFNLVIPGRLADGTEAVLKLGVPCKELTTEACALRLYRGSGAVRLLEADTERGILLLERAIPGDPICEREDEESSTTMAATIMTRLWQEPPAGAAFPSLADWYRGFERLRGQFGGTTGPFPAAMVERAERISFELFASSEEEFVLHGDLHHLNILAAIREPWLAIDPKGVIGDRAFEPAMFLLNQLPEGRSEAEILRLVERRVAVFSEVLSVPRERIIGWVCSFAVLSAWWSYEDSTEGWEEGIALAEIVNRFVDR